ncbi:PAS domain-containing hybrid sensor histidine kinase/response regulator [Algoriphagus sp. NG3]|uniref:PAS domain-containing hybrid sensor histidine kinase/response regulator n=1 Tax=Algoriphagus sp. NG3 TaxID=3097546 RepID=UPI002A8042FC|nr:ATP-binding protein [Algoriphagus sp. NG3]WPR77581.1 ATP-binding protein [Algoriphagus sp. NG3]
MVQFNKFDISDVFNEFDFPLFIIDSDEIIFRNRYVNENFQEIPDSWRTTITDGGIVSAFENFFQTGNAPDSLDLEEIANKSLKKEGFEWRFAKLPSDYASHFLIVTGHELRCNSEKKEKLLQPKNEILHSEEKYRTLVEESTEIIYSVSDTLMVFYISPNVKQFLGYDADEFIGTSVLDYLNPADLDVFYSMVGEISDFLKENQYLEFRVKHKNGQYRVFSSHGRMVHEKEVDKRFYTGIARDITLLKQTQRELLKAKEKAEEASQIKSQFLSIMSHEIKTPMHAVIGLVYLLMEENPRLDQLENLKSLRFSAENLMGLINEHLDFSKIEAGKIELERAPVGLRDLIEQIVHSHSYKAKDKGLNLLTEIGDNVPAVVIGDSVRLSQILNNLLSNAIKFTERGFVRVVVKVISCSQENYIINFKVEDTGIGIPSDKLNDIFEAFTQAASDTTRKYGGTGLGLTIVKNLVRLYGSEINVTSTLDKGTIFDFTLSLVGMDSYNNEPNSQVEVGRASLHDAKVLLAEDNLVNQILIKKFFKLWRVGKLVVASNGQEAIDEFQNDDFDLVLLDIQMPVLDGFAVAKFIRASMDPGKVQTPILMLSATSYQEIKTELELNRINGFVGKPFDPDLLYSKLIEQLNSKDGN